MCLNFFWSKQTRQTGVKKRIFTDFCHWIDNTHALAFGFMRWLVHLWHTRACLFDKWGNTGSKRFRNLSTVTKQPTSRSETQSLVFWLHLICSFYYHSSSQTCFTTFQCKSYHINTHMINVSKGMLNLTIDDSNFA